MENLKALRRRRLLTQKELAAKVGVAWQTLSAWESGRMQPRMKHIRALCQALEVTPEELLGREWLEGKAKAA